jgi:hypothetical protein
VVEAEAELLDCLDSTAILLYTLLEDNIVVLDVLLGGQKIKLLVDSRSSVLLHRLLLYNTTILLQRR